MQFLKRIYKYTITFAGVILGVRVWGRWLGFKKAKTKVIVLLPKSLISTRICSTLVRKSLVEKICAFINFSRYLLYTSVPQYGQSLFTDEKHRVKKKKEIKPSNQVLTKIPFLSKSKDTFTKLISSLQ